MGLQEKFIQHLKQFKSLQKNRKQLLAVSGGVDSVVLCDLMHNAGYNYVIAHCNFQLRGQESVRDEMFVKLLGNKYNKEVLIKRFETEKYATDNKLSIQVAARELRYEWFKEVLSDKELIQTEEATYPSPLQYIITAHHANDNIETVLMNFFKGTGIAGLHGILPIQGSIFRPLLFAKKDEILAYANDNNLEFVEDSSNLSDKYTRNYFRNQLIPVVKEIFPQVEENLQKNIERFKEVEELYQSAVDLHKKKLIEVKGNEIHIPVLKLKKSSPLKTLLWEIVKDFGFSTHQTEDIISLLDSETGKYVASTSHRVIKNRNWLIISPIKSDEAKNILIEENDATIFFIEGELIFEKCNYNPQLQIASSPLIASVDASCISFPLILRQWKQGDYFYPLGMKKKKKLSRFLIDHKVSKTSKEKIWVLEMDKKIVWIINHRIDDRFKITPSTKQVFKMTFSPHI